MLGLNKNQYDENIKNPPSNDSYPMISILFSKNDGIGVNALSLTILDLINNNQIKMSWSKKSFSIFCFISINCNQ